MVLCVLLLINNRVVLAHILTRLNRLNQHVLPDGLSAELIRRFHESAGSHTKKRHPQLHKAEVNGCPRFEMLKHFLLHDELSEPEFMFT